MRRFRDRMASFGWTAFERIRSDISRFRAISSLYSTISQFRDLLRPKQAETHLLTHKLEEVAFSICSSSAELEANQPAMLRAIVA